LKSISILISDGDQSKVTYIHHRLFKHNQDHL